MNALLRLSSISERQEQKKCFDTSEVFKTLIFTYEGNRPSFMQRRIIKPSYLPHVSVVNDSSCKEGVRN